MLIGQSCVRAKKKKKKKKTKKKKQRLPREIFIEVSKVLVLLK